MLQHVMLRLHQMLHHLKNEKGLFFRLRHEPVSYWIRMGMSALGRALTGGAAKGMLP